MLTAALTALRTVVLTATQLPLAVAPTSTLLPQRHCATAEAVARTVTATVAPVFSSKPEEQHLAQRPQIGKKPRLVFTAVLPSKPH